MIDTEKIAHLCKILSVEARVKIISLLGGGPLCVGALAHHLNITQAAVSQHLRILRDNGFAFAEKRGIFVHYRINGETLKEWLGALTSMMEGEAQRSGCCGRQRTGGTS